MLIHNTSFIIDVRSEKRFLDWFSERMKTLAAYPGAGAHPRLSVMREANGVSHLHAEAQTVAFQMEFGALPDIRRWVGQTLDPVIAEFNGEFGPGAAVFTSVFETIPC